MRITVCYGDPARPCILKCACAFLLFVFSPGRGWIGLCCLLMVDRLLWNAAGVSSSILDVNAVAVALVGGLMWPGAGAVTGPGRSHRNLNCGSLAVPPLPGPGPPRRTEARSPTRRPSAGGPGPQLESA